MLVHNANPPHITLIQTMPPRPSSVVNPCQHQYQVCVCLCANVRAEESVEKHSLYVNEQPEPLSEFGLPSGFPDLSPSSLSTPTTATSFISFYNSTVLPHLQLPRMAGSF